MITSISILKAFLDEVHNSPVPASAAIFTIGLMAGEIAKQTGSERFMQLMRMIVALDDQDKNRKEQDHAEIHALTKQLEARYLNQVEHTA